METDKAMAEMSIGEFARRTRLSPKALRLYDGVGLLSPARVDELTGYRYYDEAQLEQAWLIATLRGLEVSLSAAKDLLAQDPAQMAKQVQEFWQQAEARHAAQRRLVTALVDRLTGRSTVMYEVQTRDIPQRSLLSLKRNVDEAGTWALGKEFIGHICEARLPLMEGREGAWFLIYWGQVNADSDGPVECCKPVPADRAEAFAAQIPALTLRVEPAHREAYVNLGPTGKTGISPANFQLAEEALRNYAAAQGIDDSKLALTPADLGVRITYLYTLPITDKTVPDCDFAVPFA